jgi:hypothetical protein
MKYNIKIGLQEKGFADIYWIELDQYKDRCQVFVNAVMNHHLPQNAGISCLASNRLTSQERLCSMEK